MRRVPKLTLGRNISFENVSTGYDLRSSGGAKYYHNLALQNGTGGIGGFSTVSTEARNNLAAFNGQSDSQACPDCSHNWAEDGSSGDANLSGDPRLVDENAVIDTNFPLQATIEQKLAYLRDQIKAAYSLRTGSPAIDAGMVIPGYHCVSAGAHPSENCVEWYGTAPDIGPFEFVQ